MNGNIDPKDPAFMVGVICGALFVGALFGLIPLLVGKSKGRLGLGVAGFFACLVGGGILGLLLAVPISIVFTVIIVAMGPAEHLRPRRRRDRHEDDYEEDEETYRRRRERYRDDEADDRRDDYDDRRRGRHQDDEGEDRSWRDRDR